MPDYRTSPDTHDRILSYLEENRTANAATLCKQWGLTRADIRYHLINLLREGLIEQVPPVSQDHQKRGRPMHHYRLFVESGDENYQNLCAALLKVVQCECLPKQGVDPLNLLVKSLAPNPVLAHSLTHKMTMVVNWLNIRGYHARWEAAADGPHMKLFHCPYAALLQDHPELCRLDQLLLERLLDLAVRQTTRINPQFDHPRACVFKLNNPG